VSRANSRYISNTRLPPLRSSSLFLPVTTTILHFASVYPARHFIVSQNCTVQDIEHIRKASILAARIYYLSYTTINYSHLEFRLHKSFYFISFITTYKMIPRRSIMALCLLTALTTVVAQDPTITSTSVGVPTNTPVPSVITVTSPVLESSPSPVPDPSTESSEYYPSTPGQSYDSDPNAIIDETKQEENNEGASGKSDTFVNIPLGAQIGIISAVVVVGVAGMVLSVLWYLRRRRQWELSGRRSTVPRIGVNAKGEFTMGTQGDIPHRAPRLRAPSPADSFDDSALEKGNVRSEFENESTKAPTGWKRMFSRK